MTVNELKQLLEEITNNNNNKPHWGELTIGIAEFDNVGDSEFSTFNGKWQCYADKILLLQEDK